MNHRKLNKKKRNNMFKGPSAFAIMNPNFPLNRYFEQFPKTLDKPFLPVLYRFFGKSWKGIDEYCNRFSGLLKVVEFHLCFREMQSDKYFRSAVKQIADHFDKLGASNLKIIISPILEAGNSISDKELKRVAKLCREAYKFPIVISSLRSGVEIGKFQEVHGPNPRFTRPPNRRIYNPDGCSVQFGQKEKFSSKMTPYQWQAVVHKNKPWAAAIWCAEAQGLQGVDGSWSAPPPNKRNYVISDQVIDGMREYLKI